MLAYQRVTDVFFYEMPWISTPVIARMSDNGRQGFKSYFPFLNEELFRTSESSKSHGRYYPRSVGGKGLLKKHRAHDFKR